MSLDVSLQATRKQFVSCNHCNCMVEVEISDGEVFEANITHNLNTMAEKAGIYGVVWRPEENGIERAAQLIEPLEKAIADMKKRQPYYEQFNPSNGWGLYKNFVPWLEKYLAACKEYPAARVEASR
jgi:hypothetical protein